LAFVHIKAPDICAHDRKPEAKRDFLERLDKAIAPLLQQPIAVALSADHTTDSNSGLHTADPVPSIFYSPRMGPGIAGIKFGETACRSGTMERQTSGAFLQQVLSFIHAS
jgi:2,3-bisphosphoglycerate-independent phosphoglycerate mutase